MLAVSRLMLDNIANIKAYWILMAMPLAQVALHFGANDVQGTVVREEIFHAAGATTGTEQKLEELVRFVRDAGRIPVQRDTLYNELRRWSRDPSRPHRYVNMAPVFYRLEPTSRRSSGVPTELNRRCSPASSTSRRSRRSSTRGTPTSLRLLPRLCVSSEGAVDSIQLVSKAPLERVRTVAVTPESATSVVLTKVLLPERRARAARARRPTRSC